MEFDLDKWKEKYRTEEIVNIKEEFTIEELALLKKLGVDLKDKIYTEYEFEILDGEVIKFYYEDEMTDEALAKATGSTSYYANDKSLSQDAIEKKIEQLQEYEYETIHGQYDSVDFYDVMAKM